MKASEIAELLPHMTGEERAELNRILASDKAIWRPQPGPQSVAYHSEATVIGYGGAAGGGKGLALNEQIATLSGFKSMGEVAVGDVLFDKDGERCRVVAVSDIQHRECFEVEFDDGAVIVADDVHRWLTMTDPERAQAGRMTDEFRARRRAARSSRAKSNPINAGSQANVTLLNRERVYTYQAPPAGQVRDTLEIRRTLLYRGTRMNHSVDVAGALDTPQAELPIDPYTLGLWLGDGYTACGHIGMLVEDWEHILPHSPYGVAAKYRGRQARPFDQIRFKGLARDLKASGLLGNKHIPSTYLRASIRQRQELLRGLLDTDGTCDSRGQIEIGLSHERLANDVHELILSLGVKCTKRLKALSQKNPKWADHYRMKFVAPFPAFKLPRKLARQKLDDHRPTTKLRYITEVRPVASVPTRCIAVDSLSRTYLAGRAMIPTHNTDLMVGKALTQHRRACIFRREGTQLQGIYDRLGELLQGRDGFNSQDRIWRPPVVPQLQLEFGSVPNPGDETKYQGRPHDFKGFDEATNLLEAQVRFLLGWLRTTTPGQVCQALLTFNPPTNAEGRWVVGYFAPWLDDKHPNPAEPGEIRWFASIDGEDAEVDSGEPFKRRGELIVPVSRTFVASRVQDNPFLMGTGYLATLQSLPEPLRSQMLHGDFMAGTEDDAYQVIPTRWVDDAQRRWEPKHAKGPMDSMGVDVARGGRDETIISRRHGTWFDELVTFPGTETPDGPSVATQAMMHRRDKAPIHIDVVAWGSSPYDFLVQNNIQTVPINGSNKSLALTKEASLRFVNHRAEMWWRMREALDPINPDPIALPPDNKLRGDLCAPRFKMATGGIQIEAKDEVIRRIGRSPDRGDACCMALIATDKDSDRRAAGERRHHFGAAGWLA